jgi:hypothetical protein
MEWYWWLLIFLAVGCLAGAGVDVGEDIGDGY